MSAPTTTESAQLHRPPRVDKAPATVPSRLRRLGTGGLAGALLFLGAWELAALWINENILLVGPTAVVADLWKWFIGDGDVWPHLQASATELFGGYAIGLAIGLGLGFGMALIEPVRRMLRPLVVAIDAAPGLALAPLLLIWFGFGISAKLALVALVSLFPILVNTQAGIAGADRDLLDVARSFDASRRQILVKVRVPAALPFIIAGMQIAVTRAVGATFAAELFGSTKGIGYSIVAASQVFDTARVLSGILVLSVLGVALFNLMGWIGKKATPWYGANRT